MPESRVWVAQCLCSQRHCIVANAGEADNADEADQCITSPLREAVGAALMSGAMNPWCAICGSAVNTWGYEVGRTAFHTLDEALPALQRLELQQRVTNATFGDIPRSD